MKTEHDRFITKVNKVPSGCWEWTGAKDPFGYGNFYFKKQNGKKSCGRAHSFSYMHYIGSIPDGLVIDHLCRNHSCVNPKHLRVVTNRENTLCGYSLAATNARKTECEHGHPLTGDNVYYHKRKRKNGSFRVTRLCRTCRKKASSKWHSSPKGKLWAANKYRIRKYATAIRQEGKMKDKKDDFIKCESCGKKDKTVSYRTCGYAKEIHNEEVWETICDDCEYEHLMDI